MGMLARSVSDCAFGLWYREDIYKRKTVIYAYGFYHKYSHFGDIPIL